jgi:hypothetical protein
VDAHAAVLSLLEYFEIIYKMRTSGTVPRVKEDELNDEHMFFVPSLLARFGESDLAHPSIQYWQQIDPKYVENEKEIVLCITPCKYFNSKLGIHMCANIHGHFIHPGSSLGSYYG